jgi:hypothetical protein
MKKLAALLVIGLFLAPGVALAQKIDVDWDHGTDFSQFKTYAYVKGTPVENPLMDERVLKAIEAQMAAKGFTEAKENPDIYITYHASHQEQKTYTTDNFGYGYGMRWGGGMGTSTTRAYTYEKGTLVVDMYDAKEKKLRFRGSATETISDKPEKNAEKINKMMEKLFKKYPPKSS